MPSWLRKILIGFVSALLVIVGYGLFDPSLRELVGGVFLRLYIWGWVAVKSFVFKHGVVSAGTIAWYRVIVVGGVTLGKRLGINTAKKAVIDHVVKPLKDPVKEWVLIHWGEFKDQPRWLQFSESSLGLIIIGAMSYFVGIISFIWGLIQKVLTGKFQSFMLSILGMITGLFKFLWLKISPWFDFVVFTVMVAIAEKIPFLQRVGRWIVRWFKKGVEHKEKAIHTVVHRPVKKTAEVIKKHADKKLEKRRKKAAVESGEPP